MSYAGERLNWYPSTGTVGTSLQHPSRAAPTQLFRRGLDSEGVQQLLADPRRHTGVGYYRRSQGPRPGAGPRLVAAPAAGGSRDQWSDSDRDSDDQHHRRSASPSQGERLASFGGDVDLFTDYHCGLVDSDGEPTDYAGWAAGEDDSECSGCDELARHDLEEDYLEQLCLHDIDADELDDTHSEGESGASGGSGEGGSDDNARDGDSDSEGYALGADSGSEGGESVGGGGYSSGDAWGGSYDGYSS